MNIKEEQEPVRVVAVIAEKPKTTVKVKWVLSLVSLLILVLAIDLLWNNVPEFKEYFDEIPLSFYYFLAAGFVFAMIDGAIGMSYGVTSTAFSLSMGVPPASASTAVHLSEILSNGIAGVMHYKMGNVNRKLFWLLVIPGIIGSVTGAYLLSSLEHYSNYTKPVVSLYTLILGIVILRKAFQIVRRKKVVAEKIKNIRGLGLFGGFVDAVGGGGWGSIVLSTLIAGGRHARFSLGAVKASRFFVAFMSSLTFITMLDYLRWDAVAGLVIGSAVASPIAAKVANRISAKSIMVAVGIIVILASSRNIIKFLMSFL
ncbi:sulfite exporter TauE/SafE family protein [Pedobacter sp. SYSU D00535]|uniref:sulfite exporter TauE/SafE family protein n=1 Tax=Pedobacter sp. SYSU D00535 TaxID=2810308 RepID=UPI001A9582A4|nr:sulfite exporter TauE/SafE family protein [Pedobacter sp. SYSU D00535]